MHPKPNASLTLALPFPPSTNTYWRNVNGKTLISAAGRQYRNDVITCVVFAFAKKRLVGRLHVELDLFPPDKRKRDIDNFSKAILDGLTHAEVWLDDSQIDVMTVTRCDVNKECPGAVIRIREV